MIRSLSVLVGLVAVAAAASFAAASSAPWSVETLRGLAIREFFDASYKLILARDPEAATRLGVSGLLGMGDDELTDASPEYILATCDLCAAILDLLRTYDRASLSAGDQLSYDVYEWILDDRVRGRPFALHEYPVTSLALEGWSEDVTLVTLFSDVQPLVSYDDVQVYVARLSLVRGKMEQLVEALGYREAGGIVIPRFMVESVIERLKGYLGIGGGTPSSAAAVAPEGTILWPSFVQRLAAIPGLTRQQRASALSAGRAAIVDSFIPGFMALLRHMEAFLPRAPEVGGATVLPESEAYYAYRLHDQMTFDITPGEIRETALAQVTQIQGEMREAYAQLHVGADLSMFGARRAAMASAPLYDLTIPEERAAGLAENTRQLERAQAAMATVCSLQPIYPLDVRPAPEGAGWCYFSPAPFDGSRPGVYYVNVDGYMYKPSIPVVAFHEGIPGHYFQLTVALGLDLPLFRRLEGASAYCEGWALYAERLADELGLYTGPLERLARLDLALERACRAVMDTGIHDLGWSAEDAAAYYERERGAPEGSQARNMGRYVGYPGQGASYMVGMLQVVALRERAQTALGEQFSLREFHDLILGNGALPFGILERLVEEYIARKEAG